VILVIKEKTRIKQRIRGRIPFDMEKEKQGLNKNIAQYKMTLSEEELHKIENMYKFIRKTTGIKKALTEINYALKLIYREKSTFYAARKVLPERNYNELLNTYNKIKNIDGIRAALNWLRKINFINYKGSVNRPPF